MLPDALRWLFPDAEIERLDVERDANGILPRILEHGRLEDVVWALRTYGPERIHAFFREVGHPELSPRTIAFWRAYFQASGEQWVERPSFRTSSAAPWPL